MKKMEVVTRGRQRDGIGIPGRDRDWDRDPGQIQEIVRIVFLSTFFDFQDAHRLCGIVKEKNIVANFWA